MGKGKKKKNNKKKNANSTASEQSKNVSSANSDKVEKDNDAKEIERIGRAATEGITDSDLEALEKKPGPPPDASLKDLIAKANEALNLLEIQRSRTLEAEKAAKGKADELEKKRLAVQADGESAKSKLDEAENKAAEIEKRAAEVEKKNEAAEKKEQGLLSLKEDLLKREADADAGFARRNRQALDSLEREAKNLRDELSKHRSVIAKEREEWEKELQAERNDLREEGRVKRDEIKELKRKLLDQWHQKVKEQKDVLDARETELNEKAADLRKKARDLEVEAELLAEDRQAVEERAEQLAAAKLEHKDSEIKALQERLGVARGERDALEKTIIDREEADRRFGGRTPDEVLEELQELKRERKQLRKSVGESPGPEKLQRLEDLERQREQWEAERLSLLGEVSEMKQQVVRRSIAVTELEALRDHKAALEASNELLAKALEDEIRKVSDLVRSPDGASPFPSCSQMDADNNLQSSRPTTDAIPCLEDFANYVRHRMAYDPKTEKTLYYSAADVRSFIAGLAMSRLHLLQGISGTGKTSLPLAFARAIGAGQALVEVQAGWRDRQDLIGHFNTFERRFYESEFLQALYQARCPQYRDTPFIVVLDEMNLSHPEQYFADLLSALEQEQQRRRLNLMTAAVEPAPALMTQGGKYLPVPENVWFVGTANHDETTKDFADKTYDRAHVMELPRQREIFKISDYQPAKPFGVKALVRAFENSARVHGKEAETAYSFLEQCLGDILGRRFRVGWGNRLQRQMQDYVPVVIDCGGTVGEAADHLLATKLLRKIRDRHDNRLEDIIALRDRIDTEWPMLDPNTPPTKSRAILGEELHRLGHDED